MSDDPIFFAHSLPDQPTSRWQPLPEHLNAVGERAGECAAWFGATALAVAAGRLHDVGKYSAEFQARLRGDPQRVDHSSWGAKLALERCGPLGALLAYGIAGHHAGLANGRGEGERTALQDRVAAPLPPLSDQWQRDITLPAALGAPTGFKPGSHGRGSFQLAFLARMLFSCLVDADFLDTEAFYRRTESDQPSPRVRPMPDLAALRTRLDAHLGTFKADTDVNHIRAQVLQHVRAQAGSQPGLFSLTVPTGGGKTLASLAFALDHALAHGLRRVIFVIPFTSVVEQNAAVFRHALGDLGDDAVLEHHSAFVASPTPRTDPDRYEAQKKLQLAMENWDAPIVVTTAVQFFESLFAARPSQCRKLHNIAASVVVIDEAQTMPLKLLRPCVAAIDELTRNYRSSVVLCTATQPALEAPKFEGGLNQVRELAPDVARLFRQLERVRVRHIRTLDDDALAAELRARPQVLCIVNNRRHARGVRGHGRSTRRAASEHADVCPAPQPGAGRGAADAPGWRAVSAGVHVPDRGGGRRGLPCRAAG